MMIPTALLASCVAPSEPPRRPPAVFACDHDRSFQVAYIGHGVLVTAAGSTYRLEQRRSSIGRKYRRDEIYFIVDEDRGFLAGAAGGPYRNCKEKAGSA